MANDYFDTGDYTSLVEFTRARAAALNTIMGKIEDGFDLLPSVAEMAALPSVAEMAAGATYAADTGAADAYVVTMPVTSASYADGLEVNVKIANANTGACTINVDSLGVKDIKTHDGNDPAAGDLPAGAVVPLRYNGTHFRIVGLAPGTADAVSGASTFMQTVLDDTTAVAARATLGFLASSTDNAVARFDGTGGILQDSGVTIDDSDNLVIPGNLTGNNAAGPAVINEEVSVTNPVFAPDKADLTTGIGGADGGGNVAVIVGGAQALTVNSDGSVNNTLQPAFMATRNGTSHNVTGNATTFTLQNVTEIFDQGADYDVGTYTFTAPVTGRYLLSAMVAFSGVTAAADIASLRISTSNRTYLTTVVNTNDMDETNHMESTVIADMDASDTASVSLTVSGEASDVVDVIGTSSNLQTHFSGSLLA